jgi:hypothetical protein
MARSNPQRKATVQAACTCNAAILGSHARGGGRFGVFAPDLVSTILARYHNKKVTFRLVFVNHWRVSPKSGGATSINGDRAVPPLRKAKRLQDTLDPEISFHRVE